MNTADFAGSLDTLFSELIEGPAKSGAYILNTGDVGLLGSLDKLSARDASGSSQGGATIAAHVAHLRYGISLMNRWSAGRIRGRTPTGEPRGERRPCPMTNGNRCAPSCAKRFGAGVPRSRNHAPWTRRS